MLKKILITLSSIAVIATAYWYYSSNFKVEALAALLTAIVALISLVYSSFRDSSNDQYITINGNRNKATQSTVIAKDNAQKQEVKLTGDDNESDQKIVK